MNSKRNTVIGIIGIIVGVIVIAGLLALGAAFCDAIPNDISEGVSAICASVFYILLTVNLLTSLKIERKLKNTSVSDGQRLIESKQEAIKDDLARATRKITLHCALSKLYIAFTVLLSHATVFLLGNSFGSSGGRVSTVIVMSVFIIGFYTKLFTSYFSAYMPDLYVTEEEFPIIYGQARRAMKALGMDGKIYICPCHGFDASIEAVSGGYSINVGACLIKSLSEEELYNVFLHELAHMGNATPKRVSSKFTSFISPDSGHFTFICSFFGLVIRGIAFHFYFESSLYTLLSSVFVEEIADSVVIDKGNARDYANALAKVSIYSRFDRILSEFLNCMLYESEEKRTDIASFIFTLFKERFERVKDKWLLEFENEIQPKNASHPIYRERRNAIGIGADEVNPAFPSEGTAYCDEGERYIKLVDKQLYDSFVGDYASARKTYYLEPLETVKAWEDSGKSCSAEESVRIIEALRAINRKEDAEALCDTVIATAPNPSACAHASFYKAIRLLSRGDDSGIDLLYEVADTNSNYIESSLDLIGEYCCCRGLQQRLDEYRSKAPNIVQKRIDEHEPLSELSANDNLTKSDLSKECIDAHLQFMFSVDNGLISEIYLVKKIIDGGFYSNVFVVGFKDEAESEDINTIMNKIFTHLDVSEEQYSLFLMSGVFRRLLKSVDGSCVYSAENS